MQKQTAREKISARIEQSLVKEARRVAKRDYNDERWLSYVIEDALRKHLASETTNDQLSILLSQAEFALYDRVANKVDEQFSEMSKSLINRIGNLYAKMAFDSALSAVILEDGVKQKDSDHYEVLRSRTAKRLKTRLELEDSDAGSLEVLEENQRLKEKVLEQYKEIQELKKGQEEKPRSGNSIEVFELRGTIKNLEDQLSLYRIYHQKVIDALQENDKGFRKKKVQEVIREVEFHNPKPRGM